MDSYVRTKICLVTKHDVKEFVRMLNGDGTIDRYIIENYEGNVRVNARSYLGTRYACAEFGGEMYLVNETENGKLPHGIDAFRVD